jgi:hypothetical protein
MGNPLHMKLDRLPEATIMKALRHPQEEPLVAVADLIGLDTPARNEGLGARITRKFKACFDWLAGPPMTQRDWTI